MNRLTNRVIIVTGGNGLLGRDIIKSIRAEGAVCLNFDINHETDVNLFNVKCDITDSSSVIEALKLVKTTFGNIDGLVNNAYPRTKDWGNKFEDIELLGYKEHPNIKAEMAI